MSGAQEVEEVRRGGRPAVHRQQRYGVGPRRAADQRVHPGVVGGVDDDGVRGRPLLHRPSVDVVPPVVGERAQMVGRDAGGPPGAGRYVGPAVSSSRACRRSISACGTGNGFGATT